MSKINCSLIKDLLPLYIDDLCSNESTEIIKNHLEVCEECNKEYAQLKKEPVLEKINDNSSELIKGVGNMIKKDKKKAVLKTLAIVLAIVIVISIVAFFKVPLYIAQDDFFNTRISYPDNYEEWEICNKTKKNFTHNAVDLYIDEKYGEYEVVDNNEVLQLKFKDGKTIVIYYIDSVRIPSFEEDESVYEDIWESYLILPSVMKKGIENLGANTDVATGYCKDLEFILIKTAPPEVKFFGSYDDYATACAYYSYFYTCMPWAEGAEYYLLGENEEFRAFGWTIFEENYTGYVLQYQEKENLANSSSIHISGFTKEEAQEIFKYAVIK